MNLNYKKISRILILLVSSILIASVSAQVYRYMYIDGSITVGTAKLIWQAGATSSDLTITGSTATLNLLVEEGTPVEIPDVLRLTNQDTVAHSLNLSVTTPISDTAFTVCNMHIYELQVSTWVLIDTLNIRTSDSIVDTLSLDPAESYRMYFEVSPSASITGTYNFDIEVQYE